MAISFYRTIILYLIVVVSLRIMGKRQIGELQPSELVIAIMISDLATIPMQETGIPLASGVIPIVTLIVLEVLSSFWSLKSKKFRTFATGRPSMLVENGQPNIVEMRRLRFNYDDLMEELRLWGLNDISEVQYAILETGGQLSIILKEENRPLTLGQAKKIFGEGR